VGTAAVAHSEGGGVAPTSAEESAAGDSE